MSFQVAVWDPKNEGVFGSTRTVIQSLQYSQKDMVVQYQQLTKYDLKARKWQQYCKYPALPLGCYQWKPSSFTLLAKHHSFNLAGNQDLQHRPCRIILFCLQDFPGLDVLERYDADSF